MAPRQRQTQGDDEGAAHHPEVRELEECENGPATERRCDDAHAAER